MQTLPEVFAYIDEFAAKLGARMGALQFGRGIDAATTMGPVINEKARQNMQRLVETTVSEGADVVTGGSARSGEGYFFEPTVLANVPPTATILNEEIFGPIAPIVRFKDEAQAVQLANATEYGLSGSIWTRDVGRALRISRGVESGNLSVNSHSSVRYNTPFGGFKQSGLGRELGPDAALAFTETKNVFIPAD
mgnify:CR=1 FL=1